jgi:hypothetical protein
MTVRARFDGKVFVPIDPVQMKKDQIVELDVRAEGGGAEGIRGGHPGRAPQHAAPGTR